MHEDLVINKPNGEISLFHYSPTRKFPKSQHKKFFNMFTSQTLLPGMRTLEIKIESGKETS